MQIAAKTMVIMFATFGLLLFIWNAGTDSYALAFRSAESIAD